MRDILITYAANTRHALFHSHIDDNHVHPLTRLCLHFHYVPRLLSNYNAIIYVMRSRPDMFL
jgi:hypothetical protein